MLSLNPDGSPKSLEELEYLVDHLRVALETRTVIGVALGILMQREGIGEAEAFKMLKAASQSSNRKLRDIANEIIDELKPGPGH
jgi:AmiR/NasT family two-component response regulator